jgi:hypothetical protein
MGELGTAPAMHDSTRTSLLVLGLVASLLGATPTGALEAGPGGLRVSHLAGGGPAADDCLAGLEVVGVDLPRRAPTVVCEDGDPLCDRDRLVNGRCELWARLCFNEEAAGCTARGVAAAALRNPSGDQDLTILERTLAHLPMPTEEASVCAPLTTLNVPLGRRPNGSARKGRKVLAVETSGIGGATDRDRVKLLCKPPRRERRRIAISFASLQSRIFEKSCAFSGCHGATNPAAGLALVGEAAYDGLVARLATTAAASFAGKKLVVPGAPSTSFLIDKLIGQLGPGEGAPMPLGRAALGAEQIEAIRKWILAGAPRERAVGVRFRGEIDSQPRIPPPPPPSAGYQAKLDPFLLGDLPETEGCQLVRLGNPEPIYVQRWELFMHEGSHHFILRALRCEDADGDGTNDCDEPDFDARFPQDFRPCEEFSHLSSSFLIGAQTPHYLVDYQTATTGVALRLHRNQPLLFNSHYTNPYSDTLAEVWVNATPVDPALVRHPARILFETLANAFILVPPGQRLPVSASTCAFAGSILCNLAGEPPPAAEHFALLGLTSHMHKRSLKFVSDLRDLSGTRVSRGADDMVDPDDRTPHLYVSTDYSDPVSLTFWPPLVVRKGQQLRYTCFHDNGVATPAKLGCEEAPGVTPGRSILEQVAAGAEQFGGTARWCRSDRDCTGYGTGRCVPANLVFGELADDDMCILPGLYYPCPGDASSCME